MDRLGSTALVWLAVLGADVAEASDDRYPRWAPDGERILFESNRGGDWDVFVRSRDGSDERAVIRHPADDRYPAWAPGGERIVFQSNRDETPDLYVATLATGSVARVTFSPAVESFPDWAPDGASIAYTLEQEGGLHVYWLHLQTLRALPLTEGRFRNLWPRWAPDGERLVFFSRRDTNGEDDEIYVMTRPGEPDANVRRITHRAGHDFCPTFSPDGRFVAAATEGEPLGRAIALLDLEGNVVGSVGRGMYRVSEPSWSPDGRWIAFTARRRREDSYAVYVERVPTP